LRRDADRLADIIDAADDVVDFVTGRQREALAVDRLLEAGLVQKIVIIGEAARGISEAFRREHPDIPWQSVIGMRNLVVHAYWQVDPDELWVTVTRDIPRLLEQLRPLQQP
jgi:uncharacterized protein with HEPN domain